ncbi:hypothetical protein TNCV_4926891 [Trichonephila clavipes]|nr:hypothetical protein TNCV_4926891 [Trichonephila clavipes]
MLRKVITIRLGDISPQKRRTGQSERSFILFFFFSGLPSLHHKGWSLFEDVKGSTLHLVELRSILQPSYREKVEYLLKDVDNKGDLAIIRAAALLSLGI